MARYPPFELSPAQQQEILEQFLGISGPGALERRLVKLLRASAGLLQACKGEVASCEACRAGDCPRHEQMRAAIADAE